MAKTNKRVIIFIKRLTQKRLSVVNDVTHKVFLRTTLLGFSLSVPRARSGS